MFAKLKHCTVCISYKNQKALATHILRLLSQPTLKSATGLNIAAVGGRKGVWGQVVLHTARESATQSLIVVKCDGQTYIL